MLLLGVCALIVLVLLAFYLAGEVGRPIEYRFAGEYRGWAGIRYEDPTCAPLRTEGWYLVIPVGLDGRGCTSSPVPGGWRYHRYAYAYPDGRRRVLSGPLEKVLLVGATGPQKPNVETLFVGSEEELKRSWGQRNEVVREMLHLRDK